MKILKKKKTIIIICVIAVLAVLFIQPARYIIAITSMRTLPTQEVITDIYSIKASMSNIYLIKSGDKYIAFDAGGSVTETKSALEDLGIDEKDVIALLLTHTDYDHVAAVPLFISAEIYMAESNKIYIESKAGHSRSGAFVKMDKDCITMSDGEVITIADTEIQCIFTPGHTDGSASFVVNGKYLIAGDNLNLKDGKAVLFFSIFNTDKDEQARSIRSLAKLEGIEAIFTMHTGYTTDFKTAFSEWE